MAARVERRGRATRAAAAAAEAGSPGSRTLAIAIAVTLALRALAPLAPGRWLWGLDLARDLPPAAFWIPWAATAALLWPTLSRALVRSLPSSVRGTAFVGIALAVAMAALAWSFPDAVQFTGDSGMRHGSFATTDHPLLLVPQAMPGDLWLHWALPRWLDAHAGWPAEFTDRVLGALLALLNGLAAWRLARALGLTGGAALAVMAVAGWTASLALFSGYAKSLVELAVLELAAAVMLASVVRGGRGLVALGVCAALAIALHRSGLVLLPAWAAGVAIAATRPGKPSRAAALASALPVLAVLVWLGPAIARTFTAFDLSRHFTHTSTQPVVIVSQLLAPRRLLDVANMLLLLAPALPLLPALLRRTEGGPSLRGERLAYAALLVPALLLVMVVRPQQGLFRDWDMYAVAGVALSAWIATRLGERLSRERASAYLALPLLLLALVPATQWLAHQSDPDRALARARSMLVGPPTRSDDERSTGFDRLSLLYLWRGDADHMAEACSLSVAAAPNPRTLAEWGMAETMRQRYAEAQGHYLRAVELNPGFLMAWKGVAAASSALGDRDHMEQAVRALYRLEPDGPTVRDAAAWLERNRPAAPSH